MIATIASSVPTGAQRRWRRTLVLREGRRGRRRRVAASSSVTARKRQSSKWAPSSWGRAGRAGRAGPGEWWTVVQGRWR